MLVVVCRPTAALHWVSPTCKHCSPLRRGADPKVRTILDNMAVTLNPDRELLSQAPSMCAVWKFVGLPSVAQQFFKLSKLKNYQLKLLICIWICAFGNLSSGSKGKYEQFHPSVLQTGTLCISGLHLINSEWRGSTLLYKNKITRTCINSSPLTLAEDTSETIHLSVKDMVTHWD